MSRQAEHGAVVTKGFSFSSPACCHSCIKLQATQSLGYSVVTEVFEPFGGVASGVGSGEVVVAGHIPFSHRSCCTELPKFSVAVEAVTRYVKMRRANLCCLSATCSANHHHC